MARLSVMLLETRTAQKTLRSDGIRTQGLCFDFTQPGLRRFFRLHVDLAGKLSEFFVGGFFLVQGPLQQVDKV